MLIAVKDSQWKNKPIADHTKNSVHPKEREPAYGTCGSAHVIVPRRYQVFDKNCNSCSVQSENVVIYFWGETRENGKLQIAFWSCQQISGNCKMYFCPIVLVSKVVENNGSSGWKLQIFVRFNVFCWQFKQFFSI